MVGSLRTTVTMVHWGPRGIMAEPRTWVITPRVPGLQLILKMESTDVVLYITSPGYNGLIYGLMQAHGDGTSLTCQ